MNREGLSVDEWNAGLESLGLIFRGMWPQMPDYTVAEYVQGRRILPANTPFPGPWDNARTPYGVEFMNDASPFSPIQHSITMKARKIGFTTFAENIASYWTDAYPTDWAYISASDDLVKDWSERKFDDAIDSIGFRHKIGAQTKRLTKRSGDTGGRKEFVGGSADFYSIMSKQATRAQDKRVLIRDEIDAVETRMTTGEGNRFEINKAHTNSWGSRRKIIDLSSPTTFEASTIYAEYILGDCRKFLVPCPFCGFEQELVFEMSSDANHGLKAETEAGEIIRAYYLCDKCHEAIFNHQKTKMLSAGHYEATKKSIDPTYRSRQISALYAPVGMISWTEIYKEKIKAERDPSLMPTFTNLLLGLPYRETGSRPSMQTVISLRGDYHDSTVPEGVLYLTAGIDVQAGSEKDERNPPRLEMTVLGHGLGYRTWVITHRPFLGSTEHAEDGAWQALVEWFASGKGVFKRGDMGFPISLIFIDSGNRPDVTYHFCTRGPGMWPIKGMPMSQMIADEKHRERGDVPGGYKFYRLAQVSGGQWIYELNVNLYKKGIYGDLSRSGAANRQPGVHQKPGFADFPLEFPDSYFEGLASEEMLLDGSFKTIRDRNEPLDCFVYAKAAGHVYLDNVVKMLQNAAKKMGANPYQISDIGARQALDYLSARFRKPENKS